MIEYILCYSTEFFLGATFGFLAAIGLRRRPSKAAMWRRKYDRKRVY